MLFLCVLANLEGDLVRVVISQQAAHRASLDAAHALRLGHLGGTHAAEHIHG